MVGCKLMSKLEIETRHKIWRKILSFLLEAKEPKHSTEVALAVDISKESAYYRLRSMAAERLVEMLHKPYGYLWQITGKGRQWLNQYEREKHG